MAVRPNFHELIVIPIETTPEQQQKNRAYLLEYHIDTGRGHSVPNNIWKYEFLLLHDNARIDYDLCSEAEKQIVRQKAFEAVERLNEREKTLNGT